MSNSVETKVRQDDPVFNLFINMSPDLFCVASSDGYFKELNPVWETTLGYSLEELKSRPLADFIHPEDIEPTFKEVEKQISGHETVNFTNRYRCKDGTYKWFEWRAKAVDHGKSLYAVARDVTEQMKAGSLLHRSEALYRAILNASPDNITITDLDGTILMVTDSALTMFGFKSKDEVVGHSIFDYIASDDLDRARFNISDMFQKEVPVTKEYVAVRSDGSRFFVEINGDFIRNIEGDPESLIFIVRDISERKRIEEDLVKNEARFNQVAECAGVVVWEVDTYGLYTYVSPINKGVLGFSPEELIGKKHFYDFFAPEVKPDLTKAAFEVFSRKDVFQGFINPNVHKNGDLVILETSGLPILDDRGNLIGYRGADKDITKIEKAHELLKKSEEKFRNISEQLFDVVFITDTKGIITYISPAAISVFGYTLPEMTGKPFVQFLDETEIHKAVTSFRNSISIGDTNSTHTFLMKRKDGTTFLGELSSNVYFENNTPMGTMGVIRDITEKKLAEESLLKAKESAEESSRLKSSLLMNMSHELRTPLNGILGFSGLLAESLTNPEDKNMVDIITLSGIRLMSTLNSIMELAQVEANRTQLEMEVFDIGSYTTELLKKHRKLFEHKKIQLVTSIEPEIHINLDKKIFGSIAFHLIDNAVKFTETGSISIIVKKEQTDNLPWVLLIVKDTGKGITEEQLKYIFDAFRQGEEGFGRSYEGTGLGLTLCRKFAHLLGGKIDVESKIGIGSTFTVRFPLLPEGAIALPEVVTEERPDELPEPDKKRKVLVVEDNENNAELVAIYLKNNFDCDIAYDGMQALKMAYINDYDVILMDINLGRDMDGIKATQEIRKIERYAGRPVIAITGYSAKSEIQFILEHPFDSVLTKPFDKQGLLEIISKSSGKK